MNPFKKYSMTGTGVAVFLITLALQLAGLEIEEESLTELVVAISEGVSIILITYGTLRRKDTKYGLIRI